MSYFSMISRGEIPAGPLWLPFLEALAARMEGCSTDELVADATRWANALPRVAKLVDARVIGVGFVEGLGAGAFATMPAEPWREDSVSALLECISRLAETVRPERELAVALPGPASICRHLGLGVERSSLEGIKPGLVKLLEMVGERRPDLVVLDEPGVGEDALATGDYRRICNTLKNVTEYFGVPLGIRVTGYADGAATLRNLRTLRLDHLLLGQPANGDLPLVEVLAATEGAGWLSLGLPLVGGTTPDLPQRGTACYWCSVTQETDLELARKTGLAFAA